ncbi:MAG: SH3 domain-containing protein [Mastigocoleus sp.]
MSKFNIIKIFIASALTLTSATPAFAAQSTANPIQNKGETLRSYQMLEEGVLVSQATYSVCTRDRYGKLNMRRGPGGAYGTVLQIPNRARISAVDWAKDKNGYTWYKVYFRNYEGWVRSDFLCG